MGNEFDNQYRRISARGPLKDRRGTYYEMTPKGVYADAIYREPVLVIGRTATFPLDEKYRLADFAERVRPIARQLVISDAGATDAGDSLGYVSFWTVDTSWKVIITSATEIAGADFGIGTWCAAIRTDGLTASLMIQERPDLKSLREALDITDDDDPPYAGLSPEPTLEAPLNVAVAALHAAVPLVELERAMLQDLGRDDYDRLKRRHLNGYDSMFETPGEAFSLLFGRGIKNT